MKLTSRINKQNILLGIFFILFSLSYTTNIFHISESSLFHGFERQPEGLVVGRLARSAQDGVFSYGALNGVNYDSKTPKSWEQHSLDLAAQHDLYINNTPLPDSYRAYKTQSGGQAIVFGVLHKILPFDNANKLAAFRGLNALLIALVFCLFGAWIYRNYGLVASTITLFLILISPWVNMFAHNLWWVLWNFYLPFLVMLLILERKEQYLYKLAERKIFFALFAAVFLKCFFSGFEFITTTLISAICPIVYYYIRERKTLVQFIVFSIKASITMLLAIVAQMAVLVAQIKLVDGTFAHGINHIIYSFTKRSEFGANDVQMSILDIVKKYLQNDAFQLGFLPNNTEFYFGALILIIVAATIYIYINRRESKESKPLIVTTFFASLAPLSWLIVFKQHAANHSHIDYIIWYIPFLLFGFCAIGMCVSSIAAKLKSQFQRTK